MSAADTTKQERRCHQTVHLRPNEGVGAPGAGQDQQMSEATRLETETAWNGLRPVSHRCRV